MIRCKEEEWGQYFDIENKTYFRDNNLNYHPNEEMNKFSTSELAIAPSIGNLNKFQLIYNSKLPIIVKIGLILYKFIGFFGNC